MRFNSAAGVTSGGVASVTGLPRTFAWTGAIRVGALHPRESIVVIA